LVGIFHFSGIFGASTLTVASDNGKTDSTTKTNFTLIFFLQTFHWVHSTPTLGSGQSRSKYSAHNAPTGIQTQAFQLVISGANHYITEAGSVLALPPITNLCFSSHPSLFAAFCVFQRNLPLAQFLVEQGSPLYSSLQVKSDDRPNTLLHMLAQNYTRSDMGDPNTVISFMTKTVWLPTSFLVCGRVLLRNFSNTRENIFIFQI
jgi:hypothetical protein